MVRPDPSRCHYINTIHDRSVLEKKVWNRITVIHSHHARNTLWPQAIQILCCSFPLIHPPLFTVSRVSGTRRRGEECSVLFQSFACTSVPWRERIQQGWRRNGEWEVWEGNEQKVQNLIILGLVCLARCFTNLSHLLWVYTGGEWSLIPKALPREEKHSISCNWWHSSCLMLNYFNKLSTLK